MRHHFLFARCLYVETSSSPCGCRHQCLCPYVELYVDVYNYIYACVHVESETDRTEMEAERDTEPEERDSESVDRKPIHSTHLCSTVCSQARNAHHALGSRLKSHGLQCHLCAPEKSPVIWSAHVSSLVDSPTFHYEHIIFLIHSSFYHNTTTLSRKGSTRSPPRTPSSSCTPPSSPSRQAAPSRITLA